MGYLADGQPAQTIERVGERFKLLQLATAIKPGYDGGLPSYYYIDKKMVERANAHLELLKGAVKTSVTHAYIPNRYSLIVDKWDDGFGHDILGVVARWFDV